jgi:hypothetical protein
VYRIKLEKTENYVVNKEQALGAMFQRNENCRAFNLYSKLYQVPTNEGRNCEECRIVALFYNAFSPSSITITIMRQEKVFLFLSVSSINNISLEALTACWLRPRSVYLIHNSRKIFMALTSHHIMPIKFPCTL